MSLVKPSTARAKKFYRQSFEMKANGRSIAFHTLLVNPEEMSFDEPVRASVTQTLGGAFVTDFGAGLPTVSISGTTGYKARVNTEGAYVDGFEEFKNFRNRVYRNMIESNDPSLELFWYNWEDDEYYQIQPMAFRLQRSKAQPLLYRYELRFTCLLRLKNSKALTSSSVIKDPSFPVMAGAMGAIVSALNEFLTQLGRR